MTHEVSIINDEIATLLTRESAPIGASRTTGSARDINLRTRPAPSEVDPTGSQLDRPASTAAAGAAIATDSSEAAITTPTARSPIACVIRPNSPTGTSLPKSDGFIQLPGNSRASCHARASSGG